MMPKEKLEIVINHAEGVLDLAFDKNDVAIGFVSPRFDWNNTRGLREGHGKAPGRKERICIL